MAGYMEFLRGSKQIGAPEDSYLYSDSMAMSPEMPSNSSLGGQKMAQGLQAKDAAEIMAGGGAGFMAGGPAGAAITVGGQLASQYLAQKAADERAKRERAAQIEQNYGQDQQRALGQIQQAMMGAFR